jgi:ketosteroid isomerase-like protein
LAGSEAAASAEPAPSFTVSDSGPGVDFVRTAPPVRRFFAGLKGAADERASKFEVGAAILYGFKTGNINGVLSTLADDVGWFIPGPKDIVPFVGQCQGREQVAQAIAQFAEMQDGEQFEVQEFVAQGDKVIAFGHYRWRIKSTGHSYESDFVYAFTISQGKVSRFQE